ncbi:MAG: thymidylate kinase [Bacilli bacterium]|nr:thymidylate kinase [Bacilli bacterium]MDD4734414.1 thymidylate kinase [Bacilli bacterium]
MLGKLIVIEGTDCSGKETQTNLLMEKLKDQNIAIVKFDFPNYNSPTGKIIGGPYLGKEYLGASWFLEGAANVEPKVASLYFAADRLYNINIIKEILQKGTNVILDRYTYSNMGHQAGKLENINDRMEMYEWIEELEFRSLGLPIPDIAVFLHLPYENSLILKQNRKEKPDGHEKDEQHLKNAENAYIEIAEKYNFKTIKCYEDNNVRTIDDINEELYNYINKKLKSKI